MTFCINEMRVAKPVSTMKTHATTVTKVDRRGPMGCPG